ncbi:hypothetical protein ACTOB_002236 [Actinoplanes oblitus]|uniref:Uncharacterized protein n=1 Tax=Actinoplanes oblitus TaxID=3040509 RepID=A0ABY8WMC7_9ACTN|nr:hypothetical protein [Actinoplanes oblitus]WIM98632.1 hypothetical protein ACTOB_002236 [Actinoplanes oblitus]
MPDLNPQTTLIASGTIDGLLELTDPIRMAPLYLVPEADHVRFDIELDVTDKSPADCRQLLDRIPLAVQAAVAAATGTAVQAHLTEWSYPNGGLRQIGNQIRSEWSIRTGWPAEPDRAAAAWDAFAAVAVGADRQVADLYEVFLLGVQAMQTIAPLVGLWAFSTIVETAAPLPPPRTNMAHVLELDGYLRSEGYDLPPSPTRSPSRIRAAALHPTDESPPTPEEVTWFRQLARAYLLHRTATGFTTMPIVATDRAAQRGRGRRRDRRDEGLTGLDVAEVYGRGP